MPEGIDAVVTHHFDPFASGVARFNEMLAEALGVPRLRLFDPAVREHAAPLLSFKVSELDPGEQQQLADLLDHLEGRAPRVFLHDFCGSELEARLIRQAVTVFCGNDEIRRQVEPVAERTVQAWAPGLLTDVRPYDAADIRVFSFGMAHKVRTDMFARLRGLLEGTGRSYAVFLSHANHETATLDDARLVYEEMHRVFPDRLYFMGNLSDVAVHNELVEATFFAAFFRGGVRANNTTVATALEHGAVVITNLDDDSPAYLRHLDNVIDIERCDALPADPLELRRISVRAMETARDLSWTRLTELVRGADQPRA